MDVSSGLMSVKFGKRLAAPGTLLFRLFRGLLLTTQSHKSRPRTISIMRSAGHWDLGQGLQFRAREIQRLVRVMRGISD